jgi:hypothetical protein
VRLVARHPLRCVRDLAGWLRWRREEFVRPLGRLAPVARRVLDEGDDHVHAHFAAGAALDAMRVSRLTGVPCSVTTHGYDLYLDRRNLREKLERALPRDRQRHRGVRAERSRPSGCTRSRWAWRASASGAPGRTRAGAP